MDQVWPKCVVLNSFPINPKSPRSIPQTDTLSDPHTHTVNSSGSEIAAWSADCPRLSSCHLSESRSSPKAKSMKRTTALQVPISRHSPRFLQPKRTVPARTGEKVWGTPPTPGVRNPQTHAESCPCLGASPCTPRRDEACGLALG